MTVAELEVLIEARTAGLERGVREAKEQVRKLEEAMDKGSRRGADAVEANMRRAAESAKQIGTAMTRYVTLPVVAGLGAATKVAGDFDQALRNVDSIAKLSAQDFQRLRKDIIAISEDPKITAGPKELAAAMYDVVSSGFEGQEALEVMRVASIGAAAGMTDAATSGRALMAVMNSGISGVTSAQQAMDVLFKTVDIGVLTFEQLAGSIGDILPTAATAGVSIQEIGAAMAELTRQGISANEAATAINQLMIQIISPSEGAAKSMKSLGIEYGLTALNAKGLIGWLQDAESATRGNQQAFIDILPNVRAMKAGLGLIKDETTSYAAALEAMAGSSSGAGASQEALGRQLEGAGAQGAIMRKEIEILAIEIGDHLLPTAREIMVEIRNLTRWFRELEPETQKNIIKAGLLAAALGPVLKVVGGIISLRATYVAAMAAKAAANAAFGDSAVLAAGKATALQSALGRLGVAVAGFAGGMGIGDWMNRTLPEVKVPPFLSSVLPIPSNATLFGDPAKWQREVAEGAERLKASDAQTKQALREIAESSWASESMRYAGTPAFRGGQQQVPKVGGAAQKSGGGGGGGAKMSEAAREAERLKEQIYELVRAQALGAEATESMAMVYDLAHGKIQLANKGLAEQVIALMKASETADAEAKAFEEAQSLKADLAKAAARVALAGPGVNEQDQVSLQLFQERYAALTDEGDRLRVNAEIEARRAEASRQTADWVRDQVASMDRQLALSKATSQVEKVRIEIASKLRELTEDQIQMLEAAALRQDWSDFWKRVSEEAKKAAESTEEFRRKLISEEMRAGWKRVFDIAGALKAVRDEAERNFSGVMDSLNEQMAELAGGAELARYRLQKLAEFFGFGQGNLAVDQDALRRAADVDSLQKEIDKKKRLQAEWIETTTMIKDHIMRLVDDIWRGGFENLFSNVKKGFQQMLADMARQILMSYLYQWLSNVLAPPSGAFSVGGGPSMSAPGFAMGGPVLSARAPILVGERGPELFMPPSQGRVLSHSESVRAVRGDGGGQVVNVNFNITTPDADSFTRSRKAIEDALVDAIKNAARRR